MRTGIIAFGLFATACSQSPQNEEMTPAAAVTVAIPTPLASETGTPVDVPSDPRASYLIISNEKMSNGHREVMSRRSGPSGESYARREIDCSAGTVRYIGEGDTLAEAQSNSPNPGEMTTPVAESITGVITATACGG